jgi:hypothetical protein
MAVIPWAKVLQYRKCGDCLMNDADGREPEANAQDANAQGEVISRYEVVPYAEKTDDADLYSFRSSMPAPPPPIPPPTAVQQVAAARKNIALAAGSRLFPDRSHRCGHLEKTGSGSSFY